jgi:uracil-DNA glycosylase
MTQGRPKGACTGRLLLDQLVDSVPVREAVGHDRVDGQVHSVDKCRLAGRGLGWAAPVPPRSWSPRCRPQDPEQAGVIDDLRDHLPAAVALLREDVVSHRGRILADRASLGEDGMIRSTKVHHAHATDMQHGARSAPPCVATRSG